MEKLKFGVGGNAKLDKNIATFSLLSGYSCPGADKCYTKVITDSDGKKKIEDGKNQEFRCFSASQEVLYKNVYNNRSHNYNIILNIVKDKNLTYELKVIKIYDLLVISLPQLNKWDILRLHVGGDIFCLEYFDALIMLANAFPSKLFYAYTKSIHLWVKRLDKIPNNFVLTASYGGKYDYLIDEYKLKSVKVVMSIEDAEMWNLEIDHDDSHAYSGKDNFALLIHGSQKKDSNASKAMSNLKKHGWTGYSNQKNNDIMNSSILNLTQYAPLKYYLIELAIELNLIKDIKKINQPNKYITFSQGQVIYSDVTILQGVTFMYNDSIYDVYSIMLPGSSLVKWICNCDTNVNNMFTYNDISIDLIKKDVENDSFKLNSYNLELINNYFFYEENNFIYLYKIFNINDNYYIVKNKELKRILSLKKENDFDQICSELGFLPNPIVQKIVTNFSDFTEIVVHAEGIIGNYPLNAPLFEKKELVIVYDREMHVLNIDLSKDLKWIYYFNNNIEHYEESLLQKYKLNNTRPDLISPYFLSALGKFLNNNINNNLPKDENTCNQDLWNNIIAHNQQKMFGVDNNFENKDFLLNAAYNIMILIHLREVEKIKNGI